MNIEVNCFSLLLSAAGDPSGKLNFFHLFFENKDGESGDSNLFIAYGATAGYMAHEWLKDSIHQNNLKKQNNIN